ncbi:dynamin family protein [uncultured Brachyspira sp.]|uniref:dynamin family protein n=1 Tax=uncultured Brachyspira sp. TaxID=221953 RepID=UPI00259BA53A|nr:dynamin family protein [uncultured Brachyspira sp.]
MSASEKLQNEVERQKRKIEEIEKSIETVEKEFNEKFDYERESIEEHKKFLAEPELEIAIVGTINAGKSTFINALLQENIASTDARPETASLTKFKYADENKLEIKFYNEEEWNELWESVEESKKKNQANVFKEEFENSGAKNIKNDYLGKSDETIEVSNIEKLKNKIKDYTSRQSEIHYFVKEITVYLNNENMPKNVTIVDTPGLNDVVAYRSDITKDYIKRANAVVVCQSYLNLGDREFNDIASFFGNIGDKSYKVIILGTQIDKLNKPKEEWENIKEDWKNQFKVFYDKDQNLINNNIIGVSSFVFSNLIELENGKEHNEDNILSIYRFAKSYGIELSLQDPNLNNKIIDNYNQIIELTNIKKVNSLITNKIIANRVEEIIYDLENKYLSMINYISNKANNIKNENSHNKATLDMEKKEKEESILKRNEEIKKIEEDMKAINNAFDKIKEEWLNLNKKLKETIKNITNKD